MFTAELLKDILNHLNSGLILFGIKFLSQSTRGMQLSQGRWHTLPEKFCGLGLELLLISLGSNYQTLQGFGEVRFGFLI